MGSLSKHYCDGTITLGPAFGDFQGEYKQRNDLCKKHDHRFFLNDNRDEDKYILSKGSYFQIYIRETKKHDFEVRYISSGSMPYWKREDNLFTISKATWSPYCWATSCPLCYHDSSSGRPRTRDPCVAGEGKCDGSGMIRHTRLDENGNTFPPISAGDATFTPNDPNLLTDEMVRLLDVGRTL